MKLTDLPMGAPVAITKIRVPPNAAVAPGSWSDWVQGARGNRGSLPVDYELRGYLLDPIRVGEPIRVCRTWRNGVKADGAFISTEVKAIEGTEIVVTQNSVYRVASLEALP